MGCYWLALLCLDLAVTLTAVTMFMRTIVSRVAVSYRAGAAVSRVSMCNGVLLYLWLLLYLLATLTRVTVFMRAIVRWVCMCDRAGAAISRMAMRTGIRHWCLV